MPTLWMLISETTSMDLTGTNGFKFADFDSHNAPSRRAAIDRLDKLAALFDTAVIITGH
jgi:hypothetical protein